MSYDTVYVGTYTIEPGKPERTEGVYQLRMDTASGQLTLVQGYGAGANPSFMTFSRDRRYLYVVNERTEGGASAYALDPEDGSLTFLNSEMVRGADPCYLTIDPSGRWLLVACYSSGNLVVLPILPDHGLGPLVEHIQHVGSGPNKDRQEQAHVHSVRFDPSQRFALVADLGMDRVWVYRLDQQTGKLWACDPPGMDGKPGSGPRHIEFHPNGRVVYIANELDSTVTACTWDSQSASLESFQVLTTLPDGFPGENTAADIHITPSGEFLYVSNRGDNSLAAFRVDGESGALTALGSYSCGGDWPRNFAIHPSGAWLLVANQYSGDLVTLRIGADGALTPVGEKLLLPAPVCVVFK